MITIRGNHQQLQDSIVWILQTMDTIYGRWQICGCNTEWIFIDVQIKQDFYAWDFWMKQFQTLQEHFMKTISHYQINKKVIQNSMARSKNMTAIPIHIIMTQLILQRINYDSSQWVFAFK